MSRIYRAKTLGYFIYFLVNEKGELVANGVPHPDKKRAWEFLLRCTPVDLSGIPLLECEEGYSDLINALVRLYEGEHADVKVDVDLRFTNLSITEINVLRAIRIIPRGKVTTYSSLARALGLRSPRLIARILSRNPFPLIFPCHRVVRSDGIIGGYMGSRDLWYVKAGILSREGVDIVGRRVASLKRYFYALKEEELKGYLSNSSPKVDNT